MAGSIVLLRQPSALLSHLDIPLFLVNIALIYYFRHEGFVLFFIVFFGFNLIRLYLRHKTISKPQYLEGDINRISESEKKSFKFNDRHYPDWIMVNETRYEFLGMAPFNEKGFCKKSDIDPGTREIYYGAQYGFKVEQGSEKEGIQKEKDR